MRLFSECLSNICLTGLQSRSNLRVNSSIKSIRQATNLETLLVRAHPLRMRIQQWRQTLPADVLKPTKELMEDDGLDNCGPLRLAYLTLELLVFRALLRPLAFQCGTNEQLTSEPHSTIFQNSQSCAKLVLELVAALKANHFVNFWPSCKCCLLF